jgi:anti-anti-sigma factor
VASWTHTLVLTGELTHRTAHALEIEIERLCEEGVTGLTLDLRGLTRVDPVGVAVIAFRGGLCERRGYGFELIRGSTGVQRAFAEAGVEELLPFRDPEPAPMPPVEGLVAGKRAMEGCES